MFWLTNLAMKYQIKFKPKAEKELKKITKKDKDRILASIVGLAQDPFIGKKLKGEFEGYFSIRVWPYRIIYGIFTKELLVIIIRIGHRRVFINDKE